MRQGKNQALLPDFLLLVLEAGCEIWQRVSEDEVRRRVKIGSRRSLVGVVGFRLGVVLTESQA